MKNYILIFILNDLIFQTSKTEPKTALEPVTSTKLITTQPRPTTTSIALTFKLLITSIDNDNGHSWHFEVIDLKDPNTSCADLDMNMNRPYYTIVYWINGFVLDKTLIYCGCYLSKTNNYWLCTTTTKYFNVTEVADSGIFCTEHFRAVFLDNESLLLSGDNEIKILRFYYDKDGEVKFNISAMVVNKKPPDWRSCITKVNENYVILIGSYETSRSRTHVLLINIANGSTIQFFDLLEHRQKHVCTTFEHEGRDLVIVVGGYGWPPSSNSSEIADVFNNDKWSKGLSRNRS